MRFSVPAISSCNCRKFSFDLQLRIILGDHQQPRERAIQLLVGLDFLLRRAAAGQRRAGVGDILEHFGFVRREALHGVHQVGNQVGAAL